jgi:hypothetical protein
VQRAIEYLNAQGLRLFGIELSYFKGPAEAFVPRVVIRPTVADPASAPIGPPPPTDLETFLALLPEHVRDGIREFVAAAAEHHGDVQWMNYGVRVRANVSKKVLVTLDDARLYIALVPRFGFEDIPFTVARTSLEALQVGSAKKEWFSVAWKSVSEKDRHSVFEVALKLIQATQHEAHTAGA